MTTMPRTKIRFATREDRSGVARLWDRTGLGAVDEAQWRAITGSRSLAMVVAEADDAIVGSAVSAFDGWRAYIYHVAVDPAYRHQGVGSALMEAAEQHLAELGAGYVHVMVQASDTDGLALAGCRGFLPEGELVLAKALMPAALSAGDEVAGDDDLPDEFGA